MTTKDQLELKALEETTEYDRKNRRVIANYPFCKDPSILTDNYEQAFQLARGLEKRLIRCGMLEAYNAVLRDMLERQCLRLLTEEELENWRGLINYVSHHGVEKPKSSTTPLRIVANSSLDSNWSGNSYNSCLVKGPNAVTPHLEVLCTWRVLEFCASPETSLEVGETPGEIPDLRAVPRPLWGPACGPRASDSQGLRPEGVPGHLPRDCRGPTQGQLLQ